MKDKKNKKVEEAQEMETPVTEETAAQEEAAEQSDEITITAKSWRSSTPT